MDCKKTAQARAVEAEALRKHGELVWGSSYRELPCCRETDDFEHSYWPRIKVIYDLFLCRKDLSIDQALDLYLKSAAVAASDMMDIHHRVLFGRVWAELLRQTHDKIVLPR